MNDCPVERLKLVRHGALNMTTGEHRETRAPEWRVGPCGTPLFGKEAEAGICRACATGWEAEGNRPTETGLAQIASLTGKESR